MNINALNSVFNKTQNSYKYFWWLSIIEISSTKNIGTITFEELTIKIISKLWYPINYYKISFGKIDQCSKYVEQIKNKYNLNENINENDLHQFLISIKNSDLLIKITSELTRYVPYRFIRPWYNESIRGVKDCQVNARIIKLQDNSAPYKIDLNLRQIIINPDWLTWIISNFKLIKYFTYFELIKYLENENPNINNLTRKLEKPIHRNLTVPTNNWKKFIEYHPLQNDVFEGKLLRDIKNISIDHFIPWSFVTHDLIWNLHPVEKTINSSKNNLLPHLDYLNSFSELQYHFSKFLLDIHENKQIESYYILFNCSKDYLHKLSKEKFKKKLNEIYHPKFETAKNMGFGCNWSLN